MNRRRPVLVLIPLFLLAGCGGSSPSSTTRTTATAPPATAPPATAPRATAPPATSSTATPATTSTATTTAGKQAAPGSARSSPPPPSGARIPAKFTISAAGALSPRIISAPAGIAVRLTVVSKDSAAHTVTVKPATLHVRAHGRASTVLENLPVGGHLVELDGHQRAALVIGVAPGP